MSADKDTVATICHCDPGFGSPPCPVHEALSLESIGGKREDALARAEVMRLAKIESHKKAINKLSKMIFSFKKA